MVMEMEHVTPRRMNWIYAGIGISYYRIGGICNTMLYTHSGALPAQLESSSGERGPIPGNVVQVRWVSN